MSDFFSLRLTASDIMEPNLTYVYPHTRVQSLVSILRTTVYHAFPVVTENRQNERDFMKGNILISNNVRFKVPGPNRGSGSGRAGVVLSLCSDLLSKVYFYRNFQRRQITKCFTVKAIK